VAEKKFFRTVKIHRKDGTELTAYIASEGETAQYFTITTFGPITFTLTEPKREIEGREVGLK
jgi:hypothetical protein